MEQVSTALNKDRKSSGLRNKGGFLDKHKQKEQSTSGWVKNSTPPNPSLSPPIIEDPDYDREGEQVIPRTNKFWPSALTAFLMIIFSEIGDKTFLIAAIISMRHSRINAFVSALSALTLMTIISAIFGFVLPNLIPQTFTKWLAALLFLIFGIKMFIEALGMDERRMREEYDEVNHEIEGTEDITRRALIATVTSSNDNDNDNKSAQNHEISTTATMDRGLIWFLAAFKKIHINPVFAQTFSLTFLAEWGDRSQIATIVLAAAQVISSTASLYQTT